MTEGENEQKKSDIKLSQELKQIKKIISELKEKQTKEELVKHK
jgi:hypothetical protein